MFYNEYPASNLKVGCTVLVLSEYDFYQPEELKTGLIVSESKDSWFVAIKGETFEFNKESLDIV